MMDEVVLAEIREEFRRLASEANQIKCAVTRLDKRIFDYVESRNVKK